MDQWIDFFFNIFLVFNAYFDHELPKFSRRIALSVMIKKYII